MAQLAVPAARRDSYWLADGRIYTHTSDGHRVFLDATDLHISLHVLDHGNWEPQVRDAMMRILRPGDTFVDVGSNIGLHTLFGASIVGQTGRVHAFEALPRMAEMTRLNAEINGLDPIVSVHSIAVADTVGEREFSDFASHGAMSGFAVDNTRLEKFGEVGASSVKQTRVSTTTIDAMLDGKRVDLIKADIEGFEYLMLKGAARTIEANPSMAMIIEWEPWYANKVLAPNATDGAIEIISRAGYTAHIARYGESLQPVAISNLAEVNGKGDLVLTRGARRIP